MKLIDRYVIKELLGPFLFGIAAFTCIISGSSVLFPIIEKASRYGISVAIVGKIFLYRLPSIISLTLPMSVLLAVIICYSRLSSDSETTAFRAAGLSLFRIILPAIFLGTFVSFGNIALNDFVVPKASFNSERLLQAVKQNGPIIKKNINYTEYDGHGRPLRVVNVRNLDGFDLEDVTMAEYEDGDLARIIRAQSGTWIKETGDWELKDGIMHTFFKEDLEKVFVIQFQKEYINSDIPLQSQQYKKGAEEMSSKELKKHIAIDATLGKDTTKSWIQYHMKFSLPFACLIFSILGACVGVRPNNRSGSTIGFAFSVGIIVVYYILYSIGYELGLAKVLTPMIAAWVPNILIGFIGLLLLRRLAYQ